MELNFIQISPQLSIPLSEISFRSSRSGGPGGQNVNKVESRVELIFDISKSPSLSETERQKIFDALKNKIDGDGVLHLTSQKSRSQWENKEIVTEEFSQLLRSALMPRKKRIRTQPSKSTREKRLKKKRIISEKKKRRSGSSLE